MHGATPTASSVAGSISGGDDGGILFSCPEFGLDESFMSPTLYAAIQSIANSFPTAEGILATCKGYVVNIKGGTESLRGQAVGPRRDISEIGLPV